MWYVWLTSIIFHALVIGFVVLPLVIETAHTIARCSSIYRWTAAIRKSQGLKPERWKVFKHSCGWFWNFFGSKVTNVRSDHGDWYGIGHWTVDGGKNDQD